ncbi:hypothetical protein EYF80_043817 [Liparis tanakae]|uniref:Uncharacterized protein n=1 Tax=Liparis tanakae TaxID=230148 RepID=A0A4Z2FXI1_9TELE|nr:hypothetical protein EYF80_043817 [Liparis tanakae]
MKKQEDMRTKRRRLLVDAQLRCGVQRAKRPLDKHRILLSAVLNSPARLRNDRGRILTVAMLVFFCNQ